MLFDPLDAILSSPNKVRVLRALAPLGKGVSGREVARLAGVSRAVMHALDELVDMGVVARREATGQHLYSLNPRNYFASRLVRLFQSEATRVQAVFHTLKQTVTASVGGDSDSMLSIMVFGSAARGEAGPRSDFDVLVVVGRDEQVEAAYAALAERAGMMLERFSLRLSPVVVTLESLHRRKAEGDPFILSALGDAIHVHGLSPHELANDPAN